MTQRVETLPARINDFRSASTAGGGTALTSTKGLISIPFGSESLHLTPRSFAAGAEVVQFLLSPWLHIVHSTDLLVSPSGFTNHTEEFQDGDATDVTFASWDTLANGGVMYVGSEVPFRGVSVVVGTTVQTVVSTLTIKYPQAPAVWVDLVNSEGTKVTNDCLQQDGDETWTMPAAGLWSRTSLKALGETTRSDGPFLQELYWTRWELSAAGTANFQLRQIRGLNRSTKYGELAEGVPVNLGLQDRRVSAIEAKTDDGTANLIVNVGTYSPEGFED